MASLPDMLQSFRTPLVERKTIRSIIPESALASMPPSIPLGQRISMASIGEVSQVHAPVPENGDHVRKVLADVPFIDKVGWAFVIGRLRSDKVLMEYESKDHLKLVSSMEDRMRLVDHGKCHDVIRGEVVRTNEQLRILTASPRVSNLRCIEIFWDESWLKWIDAF
jgi:hypothetical protein